MKRFLQSLIFALWSLPAFAGPITSGGLPDLMIVSCERFDVTLIGIPLNFVGSYETEDQKKVWTHNMHLSLDSTTNEAMFISQDEEVVIAFALDPDAPLNARLTLRGEVRDASCRFINREFVSRALNP